MGSKFGLMTDTVIISMQKMNVILLATIEEISVMKIAPVLSRSSQKYYRFRYPKSPFVQVYIFRLPNNFHSISDIFRSQGQRRFYSCRTNSFQLNFGLDKNKGSQMCNWILRVGSYPKQAMTAMINIQYGIRQMYQT